MERLRRILNKNASLRSKGTSFRNASFSSKEDKLLLASAKIASSKAIRSSIALGITIKIIRDHKIYAISPDRSITELRRISKPTFNLSLVKKGMILERK